MALCPLNDEPIIPLNGSKRVFCVVDAVEVSWKRCQQCQAQNVPGDVEEMDIEL